VVLGDEAVVRALGRGRGLLLLALAFRLRLGEGGGAGGDVVGGEGAGQGLADRQRRPLVLPGDEAREQKPEREADERPAHRALSRGRPRRKPPPTTMTRPPPRVNPRGARRRSAPDRAPAQAGRPRAGA